MFTAKFWADAAERIVATGAGALLAVLTTGVDWGDKLQITAVAMLASLLKALVATQVGAGNTAALLPKGPDTERGASDLAVILAALLLAVALVLVFGVRQVR
jgi:hypothetical protein